MSPGRRRDGPRRHVLVLNAGSSTLKGSLIRQGRTEPIAAETVRWLGDPVTTAEGTLAGLLDRLDVGAASAIGAVGHRVVHGGTELRAPVVVDEHVLGALDRLAELAPLHNPAAVATVRAARHRLPGVPHVVCFDTAFHATLPDAAIRYPVPDRWLADWGIRRFGFHGLSVEWSVRRAAALLAERPSRLRLVVAHLGAGCSVTAVQRGRSARICAASSSAIYFAIFSRDP